MWEWTVAQTDVRFVFHQIGFHQFSTGWWTNTEIGRLHESHEARFRATAESIDLPGERWGKRIGTSLNNRPISQISTDHSKPVRWLESDTWDSPCSPELTICCHAYRRGRLQPLVILAQAVHLCHRTCWFWFNTEKCFRCLGTCEWLFYQWLFICRFGW